jgi:hypothetical protein
MRLYIDGDTHHTVTDMRLYIDGDTHHTVTDMRLYIDGNTHHIVTDMPIGGSSVEWTQLDSTPTIPIN